MTERASPLVRSRALCLRLRSIRPVTSPSEGAFIETFSLYRHLQRLRRGLKAAQTILQYTRRYPLTLYLVDNASPDAAGKSCAQRRRPVRWRQGRANRSSSTAAPKTAASAPGTTWSCRSWTVTSHFILNPDIQLTADTLSDLADWMAQHPDAVMARPSSSSRMAAPSSCRSAGAPCGP